jgi:UDP-3-O-[3-hydroxymyristoyl] glucosamine N-acyltransferase
MKFTAAQIAGILEGEVVGNPDAEVFKLSKIEEGTEGSLTFLANPKYLNYIYSTQATITIVNNTFKPEQEIKTTLIKVEDAYKSFSKLFEYYNQVKLMKSGIEQPSVISDGVTYGPDLYLGSFCYVGKNVTIGKNVKIYPNTFIGDNVSIGDNCVFFAGVRIYSETEIGNNCTIHSGTIIGSDGFGFAPQEDGTYVKVPQIGNVIIEDNVEIGANTTIDRATMGSTFIRNGVKIDNLCQIAHNVEVGKNSAMAAQVGIAGSAKIGERVMIGGQAGISGHLYIVDDTKIVAQSGIPSSVKKAETLMGSPGITLDDFKKSYFGFRKLPFLLNKVAELEAQIKELTQNK